MADLIPSRNSVLSRMTSGERRFSERLQDLLEDDYLCWFNVPVGPKQLQPDFILLHPLRGLLIVEVKDWKIETVQGGDRESITILTDHGAKMTRNPLVQARGYAMAVTDLLQKDPALCAPAGSSHAGSICMPFGWGVVLANITRQQFERAELGEVIEPSRVICKDEMTESVDAEAFQSRLWSMFKVSFPCRLTLPQIDRVRWHLFPDIRIAAPVQGGLFVDEDATGSDRRGELPELIRIMDREQERLARSLGEGHRVIHGVAGSGKTMILGYRSVHLARLSTKPILVLCYNVALAARLRQMAAAQDLEHRVAVRTFHAWCFEMLKTYHGTRPPGEGQAFFDALVERVIVGVDQEHIPRGQYGAILLDEGHDFQPHWFKLIAQMVDPESNSLLVLYDDAQAINRRGKGRFSFASVGIQAKGRTRILQLNYRNTYEILEVARNFAAELLEGKDADEDDVPLVAPTSSGRHGPVPEFLTFVRNYDEAEFVATRISDELERGTPPDQIGVLYRDAAVARAICSALDRHGIRFRWAVNSQEKKELFSDAGEVKLVTLESSKGLEFSVAFLPGISGAREGEDPIQVTRLLHVAMTRAMVSLVMSCTHMGEVAQRVQATVQACMARSKASAASA